MLPAALRRPAGVGLPAVLGAGGLKPDASDVLRWLLRPTVDIITSHRGCRMPASQDACIAALAGVGTSGFLTILLLSWYSALQRRDIGSKRCSVRRCAAAFVHVASVGSPRWAMLAKQVMLEEAARDMARHRVLDTIGEQRLRSET